MKIYTNGNIITMSNPVTVEAVLVDNGKIIKLGSKEELIDFEPNSEVVDLKGNTLMPAFIDAHSHFSSFASSFLQVNLEESFDFKEIKERVQDFIKKNDIKEGEWVLAKGYDHNSLNEKSHPSLVCVDDAAPKNPLILQHASGHVGVFNTLALNKLGITSDTIACEGGKIGVENGELTGYLEENSFFDYLKKVPMTDMNTMLDSYNKAQKRYAANGITTIQEGMTLAQMIPLYQFIFNKDMLYLDLVSYVAMPDSKAVMDAFKNAVNKYEGHFKIGGLKIFLDGSPQGRTAWMKTPYLNEEPPYYGYGTMKYEDVLDALKFAVNNNLQILAHCNGDKAAEQYIDAIKQISEESDVSKIRPVMIHSQLLNVEQLPMVKELSIIPTYFIAHVYHWGDVHVSNFGLERASKISPVASSLNQDILFTFHQDSPVIEPNMLETVWCAVNRITKSNVVLGSDERISVMDALKAITINAAYQYFEEDIKGSIDVGKNADFVILDNNPLTVDPLNIKDIQVLETIKTGEVIYSKN